MPLLPTITTPRLDEAVSAMLAILDDYLPAAAPPLPAPTVSLVGLTERAVGVGGHRGLESRGDFAVLELRGVRVDAQVRFQLWGSAAADAETAAADLSVALLGDRDALWGAGFLRFALDGVSSAVEVPSASAWRAEADYRVLFEYRTAETGGAESLIARIPIHTDPEEHESLARETSVVTDEVIRWDELAAPPLVLRGRRAVRGLTALSFLPASAPSGAVTLTRTFDGAPTPPTTYASLSAFLDAVAGSGAPERNGRVVVGSPSDFLAAFAAAGDPVELGDWDTDGTLDTYDAGVLEIEPAIQLPTRADRLEVEYAAPVFDQPGVVYLRAGIARL